jgi:hypothetical protein
LEASLELHHSPSAADDANDEKEQHTKIEKPPMTFSSPMKPSSLWATNSTAAGPILSQVYQYSMWSSGNVFSTIFLFRAGYAGRSIGQGKYY